MANLTLYDLACLQRNDPYTGLIEDVTTLAPEFTTFSAQKRDGWWYSIVKRESLPTAQFRSVNEGVTPSKSTYKKELKEMFFIDTHLQVDEAVWDADDGTVGPVWNLEAKGALQACSILIGQQTWYGTSADSKGFAGLAGQLSYAVKGNQTATSTSAYLVWQDPQEGVRYDVGKNGNFAMSMPTRQQIVDVNNSGKTLFAYVGNLKAYVGLFVGSSYSVWGVTGVTSNTAAYNNGLTDAKAIQLVSYIPVARRNNLRWFMNRTTMSTLQQNRSAVTAGTGFAQYVAAGAGGAPAYSPIPESLAGYPITVTDSILNTETNS